MRDLHVDFLKELPFIIVSDLDKEAFSDQIRNDLIRVSIVLLCPVKGLVGHKASRTSHGQESSPRDLTVC